MAHHKSIAWENGGRRAFASACLVGGIVAIAAATLTPLPGQASASADTSFFCVPCGEIGGVDIVVNILLFVPFGLALRLLGLRGVGALAIVAFASGTVELLQATVVAGRDAALSDIISNTIGGGAGVALGRCWWSLVLPGRSLARRLAWSAASLVAVVMALSAYLLRPSWPATPWWGQWQPLHLHTAAFRGRVIDARIAGVAIPRDSLREGPRIRRALRAGSPVEATVIMGPPTAATAPILRIAFNDNEVAMVAQSRRDVVFRIRLRAADVLLQTPSVRLPGVLPAVAGDTVRIGASLLDNRYRISVTARGSVTEYAEAMHPTVGWAMLLPFDVPIDKQSRWFSALWVATMFVPLGYWAVLAGSRPLNRHSLVETLAPIGSGALVSLAVVPLLFGFDVAGSTQCLAAVAGVLAGGVSSSIVTRPYGNAPGSDSNDGAGESGVDASPKRPAAARTGTLPDAAFPEHLRR